MKHSSNRGCAFFERSVYMKKIYTCGHIYKSSCLPGNKEIDDLCPDCKKKKKLEAFIYEFEEMHGLEHFTSGSPENRFIASYTRFRLLTPTNHHWLSEMGLFGYMDALMEDVRDNADELIEKTERIIHSDIEFWYEHRYDSYMDLVKYIEIGDYEE